MVAINVGGEAYSASNGITYIADRYYVGGDITDWSWVGDVAGTNDESIYLSERWGDFQYSIPMPSGSYDVLLQFSELNWTAPGDRRISAVIENISMLRDFDIYNAAGFGSALDLKFGNIQVKDGNLTIKISATADAGTLAGIVVTRNAGSGSSVGSAIDYVLPSTPINLTASKVVNKQLSLTWGGSTDNVGVVGYRIYRDGAYITTVTGLSYDDLGLTPDTTYQYTVKAVDGAGNESVPVSLTAKTYMISGGVTLQWADPSARVNGTPLSGSDIGGFQIRYKLVSSTAYTVINVPAKTYSYTFPNLSGDYIFEIATVDVGGLYSEYVRAPNQ